MVETERLNILRLKQVEATVGLKRSRLYDMVEKRIFPQPIKLGSRSVGWLEHEVQDWIKGRVLASRSSR